MHTKCHTQSERAFIICTQSEQGNREKKVVHGSMHTCTHNETKDRMPVFSLAHEMHGKKMGNKGSQLLNFNYGKKTKM